MTSVRKSGGRAARPQKAEVEGRRKPEGETVGVDLKPRRLLEHERQAAREDAEVAREVVVGKEAPLVDARAPADGEVLVPELQRAETRAVVPRRQDQNDDDGQSEEGELFGESAPLGLLRLAGARRADGFEQEDGTRQEDVGTREKREAERSARHDRPLGSERKEQINAGERDGDDMRGEPNRPLLGGEEVDRAEREDEGEGEVLQLGALALSHAPELLQHQEEYRRPDSREPEPDLSVAQVLRRLGDVEPRQEDQGGERREADEPFAFELGKVVVLGVRGRRMAQDRGGRAFQLSASRAKWLALVCSVKTSRRAKAKKIAVQTA